MNTKTERTARYFDSMSRMGFTYDEANRIRRIELTLSRWSELECGNYNNYASWAIERDEKTEVPYMVRCQHADGKTYRTRIADREAGALRRLQQIMAAHPALWFYHQGDPRGCAVYIGRKADIRALNPDKASGVEHLPLDQYYTRGVAACIG